MNSRRLMSPKTEDDSLSHRSEAIVRHSKCHRSTSGLGQSLHIADVRILSALLPDSDRCQNILVIKEYFPSKSAGSIWCSGPGLYGGRRTLANVCLLPENLAAGEKGLFDAAALSGRLARRNTRTAFLDNAARHKSRSRRFRHERSLARERCLLDCSRSCRRSG
jgi:hypothetical protein